MGPDSKAQAGFMFRGRATPLALAFEVLLINRLWPRNPVNWHYRCLGLDDAVEQSVDQPAGAFLMVRRDVWNRLGGFDESFHPLWFEDVDFCERARQLGYRFVFTPEAAARHAGAHSISQLAAGQRQLYWYGSLLRYAAKHFSPWSRILLCLAVIAGVFPRMVTGVARRGSLGPIQEYGRVMALAFRRMLDRPVQ
jgi:N-acetylglucosaminyl-diphospho-decaprenol L-rhamnosyltransferase